jgi:Trehalose utilisation.
MKRFLLCFGIIICWAVNAAAQQWIRYDGGTGAGRGKHIVLISGDEEYRSEEAMPMLAKILSQRFGFTCTVLFAIDNATGCIDPTVLNNIPGLHHLSSAHLMILFTRFRELPDDQMKYIDDYLQSGKPVIGIRTATHAFNYKSRSSSKYARYSFRSTIKDWENGFGAKVLGDTWVAHHGIHGKEGTRALVNGIEQRAGNPLLNGVKNIWVPSDVYTVEQMYNTPARVLLYGQCTSGMDSSAPVNLQKSIMPVAWTKNYSIRKGVTGKVFATTMGSSVDFLNEDLRRLLINACFWALDIDIPEKADVTIIGDYQPTMFGFNKFVKGTRPADKQ